MTAENNNLDMLPDADASAPTAEPIDSQRRLAPPRKPRVFAINGANIILAALFGAGLATVYLLSLRVGPTPVSAAQQQTDLNVETALSQLTQIAAASKARRSIAKDVIAGFYLEAKQRQIPAESLKCNPFTYRLPVNLTPADAAPPETPAKATEEQDAQDALQAMEALKTLTLQSVMMGAQPTAMISNNLLSEGQQIAGWTVAGIKPKQVVLKWREQTRVLKME